MSKRGRLEFDRNDLSWSGEHGRAKSDGVVEDAMRSVDRAIAEVETSSSRDSVRLMDIMKRPRLPRRGKPWTCVRGDR